MKESFHSTLTGGKWWKPFLAMVVLLVITLGAYEFSMFRLDENASPQFAAVSLLFGLVMLFAYIAVVSAFTIVLTRISAATVAFKEKPFSFDGKVSTFVKLVLGGTALTCVTLGFYGPWFIRKYTAYMVAHVEYDGDRPQFLGKAGKLLKYGLLSLVLPLIVLMGIFFVALMVIGAGGNNYGPQYSLNVAISTLLFEIVLFFALIPYEYLVYRWYMNISWKNRLLSWKTEFWPSVGYIAGQLALTIVTVGIYWPAFLLRLMRYFSAKTVLTEDARELGRCGQDIPVLKGFFYIWGQTLLSIITVGIYLPWAYANVIRFIVNGTYYETEE